MQIRERLGVVILFLSLSDAFQSLLVVCREEYIQATVLLSQPMIFGLVYTEPDRHSCVVLTGGERELTLYLPLTEPGASRCGVVKRGRTYTAVLTARAHHQVEMADDTSFLVQCSTEETKQNTNIPKTQVQLEILKSDNPVVETMIGENYAVELRLANDNSYKVTSCTAFGTTKEGLEIVPLIDNLGCPVDGKRMTPFYPVTSGGDRFRAELSMFRFNGSHQLQVQCAIAQCLRSLCIPTLCQARDDHHQPLNSLQAIPMNRPSVVASKRVSVADHRHRTTIMKNIGCPVSTQLDQVLFLLATAMGTLLLCLSAIYNRPFHCKIQMRHGSLNMGQDLLEIGNADSEMVNGSSKISPSIVQYRRRFPFPLAMPPFPMGYRSVSPKRHGVIITPLTPDDSDAVSNKSITSVQAVGGIDRNAPPIYENTLKDGKTPRNPTKPIPPPRWCFLSGKRDSAETENTDGTDSTLPSPPRSLPTAPQTNTASRASLSTEGDGEKCNETLFPPPPPSSALLKFPPPVPPKPLFVVCGTGNSATDDDDHCNSGGTQRYRAMSECYQTITKQRLIPVTIGDVDSTLLAPCSRDTTVRIADRHNAAPLSELILSSETGNKMWYYDF